MEYRVEYLAECGAWMLDAWFLTYEEALDYAVQEAKHSENTVHRVVKLNPEVLAEIKPMGGL